MYKLIHRFICCLFCVLLLVQFFPAAPGEESFEELMTKFRIDQGLDASNFSMSYYNPVSDESYAFNEDLFLPVGKLRFLPTHMYFYEEETRGTFEPETPEDPEFTIGGMNLEDCRYHSIILSEDGISEKMQAQIGTTSQYLELINQRYGMLNADTLPTEYWTGRMLSIRFLMNCIRTVSSRPELFNGMMSNYSMVQEANGFANGSVSYPIVQIRGETEEYITVVAEISAAQNFLLAASVKISSGGDQVLGALNKTICDYLLSSMEQDSSEETTIPTTAPRNTPNYYIGQERLESDGVLGRWLLLSFSVAGGVALISLVIWLIWRARNRQY